MNYSNLIQNSYKYTDHIKSAYDYLFDAGQRNILFMDLMRKRGNIYIEHILDGKPPVLTFPYEIIMDGRDFDPPVNFALARILERRSPERFAMDAGQEKRIPRKDDMDDSKKRPIIIVDPRAGHGPGIGGAKRDSEIGMAITEGHQVYFILFTADPMPDQTIGAVHSAQIRFIEEVIRRHPDAEKPAIIGNCQAGWAAALIGADRPDLTGPLVFNGSPLSFWAGVEGKNPMRYRGGLLGGVWLVSFMCDLGNGMFDGAHIVAGFEDLNPANTLWDKQYYVYSNVDTEGNRYLDFERWWNGFFMLTREEMHYIVDSLFVGNKLEEGRFELNNKRIDLKKLKEPVLIFASSGDNITPPQQALNWIYKVWGSVDEIKRRQQVIVYLLHDTIGHLGIFVSGKISKKEHKEIIASIDVIEYLSPGLYEMFIDKTETAGQYTVRFEAREMKDILALDDGLADEEKFPTVAWMSELVDRHYRAFISPWVRAAVNEEVAKWIRQLHPLRMSKYMFSDINPWMMPFKVLAPKIKAIRKPVSPDNPYVQMEKEISNTISDSLDLYRYVRDLTQEFWFKTIYGNPWMELFRKPVEILEIEPVACSPEWIDNIDKGGFAEGVVRILVAAAHVNKTMQRRILHGYDQIVAADNRLAKLSKSEFKIMIRKQACLLNEDKERAMTALAKLIPDPKDREDAYAIAKMITLSDHDVSNKQRPLLRRIRQSLQLAPIDE